jgi:(1->4)-alpha-D-glucan 1-alpha-D-glucosylmutase
MRPECDAPRATYRLQLHPGFDFDAAAALAPYLRDLGVSHLYCSPILEAAPGSMHGYDVVDHDRISSALGGDEGWARLVQAARASGLGIVLDIVPNHMAIAGRLSRWWWDVLENGPSSRWAGHFDVDWNPPEAKLRYTVLVPVLGDHYGRVLDAGQIGIDRSDGAFVARYHEHEWPLAPRSLDVLLGAAADAVGSDELRALARDSTNLPDLTPASPPDEIETRHQAKETMRRRLHELLTRPEIAAAVDAAVAAVNADREALHALLERQHFRLARWRIAGQELDYRRFFDIPSLVALRSEDPQVFMDTHARVLALVRSGQVQTLRIDHPDGLRDPEGYLARLRAEVGDQPCIIVEKILSADERLRPTWPIAGTTGYEFANLVTRLFVNPDAEKVLDELYVRFTNDAEPWADTAWRSRHEILTEVLAADLERLTALAVRVAERHRRHRDHTRAELRAALRELLAGLDVYRTYVRPDHVETEDTRRVDAAAATARTRRPDLEEPIGFLVDVLLLRLDGPVERDLAARFQQTSAAAMAKGVEDTAFYRYGRLVALNEVGGDPGRFAVGVDEFHARVAEIGAQWPATFLATSTHDTKRSEDVRLRIALLSEMPERWASAVWRWAEMNERHRKDGLPDRGLEYLFYQTVVGAHPLPLDRALAYLEKAAREAKRHTSWLRQSAPYEDALRAFVTGAFGDPAFVEDVAAFCAPLVGAARIVALAQTLLKTTVPGVPDFYQGTEVWDLSLVDPDNRRPVDFDARRALVAWTADAGPEEALARADEGASKCWLIQRALGVRAADPDAFAGDYVPLAAAGSRAAHVVAFVRGGRVAAVVPRFVVGLADGWADTTLVLPDGRWRDAFSGSDFDGGAVPLAMLLARFPVALLTRS